MDGERSKILREGIVNFVRIFPENVTTLPPDDFGSKSFAVGRRCDFSHPFKMPGRARQSPHFGQNEFRVSNSSAKSEWNRRILTLCSGDTGMHSISLNRYS